MPNPVVDRTRPLLTACVIVSLCAACAPVEAAGAGTPSLQVMQTPFVAMVAEGSMGHRLEILTTPGVFDRASAVLTFEGQVWRVSDEDCPAFRDAIQAYQRLPLLRMGPRLLLPGGFRNSQMPAGRPDSESWTFKTDITGSDGASMRSEVWAVLGPYAIWASDVVRVIKSCGQPGSV